MTTESRVEQAVPGSMTDFDKVVKVTCHANCSYQRACLLNAFVKDGNIVHLEQAEGYLRPKDPDAPDWEPRGCQKGLVSLHRMADESRIKYPLKRVGERGSRKWERISWEQALTEIADTMLDVITTEGADTIVRFAGSGASMGSETASYETLMNALGIAFTSEMQDLGDEHQGAALVFGQPYVGCSVDNWYYADILLVWGGNPAFTGINNYHFITEARYNGTKVVAISPDFNASAVQADVWVPVNIGADAALALSMSHVIIQEKLYKADFIREQTDLPLLIRQDNRKLLREADLKRGGRDDIYYFWDSARKKAVEAPRRSLALGEIVPALEGEFEVATLKGKVKVRPVFDVLKERLQNYAPEKASKVTGVSPDLIRRLARDIAAAKGVSNVTTFNWGKFYNGQEIERSIILVFALCGHMGRKGAVYSGFTGLAVDATVSGVALSGWIVLQSAAIADPRYAQWKNQGMTDEMIIMEYARDQMNKGGVNAGSLFHYIHSGLLEMSQAHNSWDPTLKRKVQDYVKEALDKGWQTVTPKPGKDPRIVFNMGGSFLRRCRATEHVIKTLLPKLKMMVVIDHRMGGTGVYADYVLPAAGWFEKFSLQGPGKIDYPYSFLINKVVEPAWESKNEWEMGCLLAKKLEERAKARGISAFTASDGTTKRLDNLYEKVTINGMYSEEDEEAVTRDYYTNAANLEQIPWEELKEKGVVPAIRLALNYRGIGNACDIVPGEPVVPLTWHVDKKEPYPTQTRRMQFYIDHDWYLEFGEELPVQKVDPKMGGDYPLRMTGGHARWSIHASQADDAILLRLQRGEPVIYLSREDARARSILDGDRVEVYNDISSFRPRAVVSAAVRPGQVIVYHAWENYQFPGWKHFKNVQASGLNPIELVGGYYHIGPTRDCFAPGFSDRETRVEIRRAQA